MQALTQVYKSFYCGVVKSFGAFGMRKVGGPVQMTKRRIYAAHRLLDDLIKAAEILFSRRSHRYLRIPRTFRQLITMR